VAGALNTLVDYIFSPEYEAGLDNTRIFQLAELYGKPLTAYEGGQHLHTFFGAPGSEYLSNWLAPINRHPLMRPVYLDYLDRWESLGGSTFVHFADFFPGNESEAFGLKDNWRQADADAPKLLGILDWLAASGETPSGGTFDTAVADFFDPAYSELPATATLEGNEVTWLLSPAFGAFLAPSASGETNGDFAWIYHAKFGWCALDLAAQGDGVWLLTTFDPNVSFIWTSADVFPYAFDLNRDTWLYFERALRPGGQLQFYNFALERFELLGP
jgi:hypothetical protein